MKNIVNEINTIADKYGRHYYVRADEPDLTLWGIRVNGTMSTIALYKRQNKLLAKLGDKKCWFTTNAYLNYRNILNELTLAYERTLKGH